MYFIYVKPDEIKKRISVKVEITRGYSIRGARMSIDFI